MLHAGLEGIEHGYELPEPMEQNLYHLTPEERAQRGIEQLPETLGEAIEIAAESELVLRILGEHTFKRFIEIKRAGVGGVPGPGHALGARALPADPLTARARRGRPTLRLPAPAADWVGQWPRCRSITGSSASGRPTRLLWRAGFGPEPGEARKLARRSTCAAPSGR